MWALFALGFLFVTVNGHSSKIQNEGDLQSELMPQELNPEFVAGKDLEPWKAIMPLTRLRRDVSLEPVTNYGDMIKRYSRVAACVVLVISAVVEIGLYVFESYSIG